MFGPSLSRASLHELYQREQGVINWNIHAEFCAPTRDVAIQQIDFG
jgi:hypothetical protein